MPRAMYCSRCEPIQDLPARKYQGYAKMKADQAVLHRNIEEFRDGLAVSCWWCSRLAKRLMSREKKSLHELQSFRSHVLRVESTIIIEYDYESHTSGFKKRGALKFECENLPCAVKLEARTDSTQSWQYIERRLRECEESHKEKCGRSENGSRAPTWLIKIETPDDSERRCRLVKSFSEAPIQEYVTMSHRWQSELMDHLKLCTSNLEAYIDSVPMKSLPNQYADAVEVTWKLGLRYLWIDFLCIVQDNDDLPKEIGRMTDIYRNAYCNLSATSTEQGSGSLFFDRDYTQLPLIFTPNDADIQCAIMDRFWSSLFKELDFEPLYNRAWVCQERLLARRNISFTKNLIFIECQSSIDCEIGPVTSKMTSCLRPAGVKYRLAAISGLARYIAGATKVDYLAGLWNSGLTLQLGWVPLHGAKYKNATKPSRAPSWSWANTDMPVRLAAHRRNKHVPVVEILEAKCEDTYEAKSMGYIRLHGWLVPFAKPKNFAMRCEDERFHPYMFTIDIGLKHKLLVSRDVFPAPELTNAKFVQELKDSCYALPLYFSNYDLDGIIVTLTPTNEFRRVGTWSLNWQAWRKGNPSEDDAASKDSMDRFRRYAFADPGEDESYMRTSVPLLGALLDSFEECDLPFLKNVPGERKLITLV
ncbi:heterokaryon incompatibility protein-domain-containing protein [Pestalotiopsis sp. NC0098]|nr:heterokaryon incompatibility protein-domain-containing protein [Pestalotiopsis sp. NC0098]